MTTKKSTRNEQDPRSAGTPSQEEVRTAHQIHTLAQMLYGRLAMTNPWFATPPPGVETTGGFAQVPWAQAWPAQPGLDPVAGAHDAPWLQTWAAPPGPGPATQPGFPLPTIHPGTWMWNWPVNPATAFGPAAGWQQAPWGQTWPATPFWACGCWR